MFDKALIMTIAGAYRREGFNKSISLKMAWSEVKKSTYRKAFNSVIRSFVTNTENKDFSETYNEIYEIYKSDCGVDVFEQAANTKFSKLDIVSRANGEKDIYEIAVEYINSAA